MTRPHALHDDPTLTLYFDVLLRYLAATSAGGAAAVEQEMEQALQQATDSALRDALRTFNSLPLHERERLLRGHSNAPQGDGDDDTGRPRTDGQTLLQCMRRSA